MSIGGTKLERHVAKITNVEDLYFRCRTKTPIDLNLDKDLTDYDKILN